jgi:CRP/FNR family transcriptional activator FtrB
MAYIGKKADAAGVIGVLANLASEAEFLVGRTSDLKLKTTAQRLAEYFLELAAVQDRPVVELPVAKGVLARDLGMTPQSLSRTLRHLRALGVEVDGTRVHLADPDRVRDFCHDY